MKSGVKATVLVWFFSHIVLNVFGQQHGSECVVNADCNEAGNLHCNENKCECIAGHTSNREGRCAKSFNETCGQILDCNIDRQLTCDIDKTICQCQKHDEQMFDDGSRQSCVSLVGYYCAHASGEFTANCVEGAFCDMPIINGSMTHQCKCNPESEVTEQKTCQRIEFGDNVHDSPCQTNADCDERANLFCSGDKKCECIEGYTPTARKTCQKTFGQECVINAECNEDRFLSCTDEQEDLTKRCECQKPTEQIYEEGNTNACVSLVGFDCSMTTGEFYLNCVEGAFCDMPIVDGIMLHRCKCNSGYSQTANLTCEAAGHSMNMAMTFHTGTDETVLFDFWKTKGTGPFIGSLIVIFIMSFGYEALKFVRELLFEKAISEAKQSRSSETTGLVGNTSISAMMFNTWHITQTFLHMFQFVLSYFLMLIFMSYNVWLGLTITIGAGVGFICFGWKKPVSLKNDEHCQ